MTVIAIIGVFSSITLVSLQNVRFEAKNTAIKSNMHALADQAEIYFYNAGNNSYGVQGWLCPPPGSSGCNTSTAMTGMFSDQTIINAIGKADTANDSAYVSCGSNATSYAVVTKMKGTGRGYWCVDSVGSAKEVAAMPPCGGGTYYVNGVYGCFNN